METVYLKLSILDFPHGPQFPVTSRPEEANVVPDLAPCQDQGACAISRVLAAGSGRIRRKAESPSQEPHPMCRWRPAPGVLRASACAIASLAPRALSTFSPCKNKNVSVALTSDYHVTTHEGLVPLCPATNWGC